MHVLEAIWQSGNLLVKCLDEILAKIWSNRATETPAFTATTKGRAREARARPFIVAVPVVVSVSGVGDHVDRGDQVVPAHQVDDIDEVHELDPVHQVDHKDELSSDLGATLERP